MFQCSFEQCAPELYSSCLYGLQQDNHGCDVCACRPDPELWCSSLMCSVLCQYFPHHLYLCSNCPCLHYLQPQSVPTRTVCYGASAEHVDAAMTGQTDIIASHVIQRDQEFCYSGTAGRWRTADGTCNNVRNYGATFMPVARFLPPAYDDGLQAPRRRSVVGAGYPLPGPREVSRVVHSDGVGDISSGQTERSMTFTLMLMQFGQFLDHDITSFPLPTNQNKAIPCCTENGNVNQPPPHPDCLPIQVSGDPHFSVRCMQFIRSVPVTDQDGHVILPRENVNAVTSFVDGSSIYGSSDQRMRELRDKNGTGMYLKTSPGEFLPLDGHDSCVRRQTSNTCFVAGDDRVNEQPGLTALHTVFLRLHNRIAASLHRLLPWESEEEIFQKSRAIVGATLQNIVYGTWLPIVLGPWYMHRYGLNTGVRVTYNADLDSRVISSFSTAAFRFGHSMIPRSLSLGDQSPPLRNLFNRPFLVQERLIQLIQGLIDVKADPGEVLQTVDHHFVGEITNHLFEPADRPFHGLDLVSLNIQRGRDHGLPSFTQFRKACGLGVLSSFFHPALGTAGPVLQQVYRHVDDIDLFTGGMAEQAQNGALVGPTFACLIARQFHALKFGDRFYFEAAHGPHGFSEREVSELRKATLGWVLCSTLPFYTLQRDVFRKPDSDNPMQTCDQILAEGPDLNVLTYF